MEREPSRASHSASPRVLWFSESPATEALLASALADESVELCRAATEDELIPQLDQTQADIFVVDIRRPTSAIRALIRQLGDRELTTRFVWLVSANTPDAELEDIISNSAPLTSQGTFVCLEMGWSTVQLRAALAEGIAHVHQLAEVSRLNRRLAQRRTGDLIGQGPAIESLRQAVVDAAANEIPVHIHGGRGTGKKLVARAIHDVSSRAYRPFIRVNCSVLTSANLERELFGRAAGIDSLGPSGQAGRFELAQGGMLLLEDVDQIAFPLQIKLLETLQTEQFERLGEADKRSLDVRIISTSRCNLRDLAAKGSFHPELLSVLCRIRVRVPSLSEHPEDIAPLTEHVLNRVAAREGEPPRRIPVDTLQLLRSYDWPGNVGELETTIERACALEVGSKLTVDLVRPWLSSHPTTAAVSTGFSLEEMERKLIESTFARFGGNRERTAQALKIGLRTLSGKLREYGYPPRGGPGSNRNNRDTRAA